MHHVHTVNYQHRIRFISGLWLLTIIDDSETAFHFFHIQYYRWVIERVNHGSYGISSLLISTVRTSISSKAQIFKLRVIGRVTRDGRSLRHCPVVLPRSNTGNAITARRNVTSQAIYS